MGMGSLVVSWDISWIMIVMDMYSPFSLLLFLFFRFDMGLEFELGIIGILYYWIHELR